VILGTSETKIGRGLMSSEEESQIGSDFIRRIIKSDVEAGKNDSRVHTRFPPEPNGYLHIGHAKSICLNFGVAAEFEGGLCNLRFDDTNPCKEETEYVESIKEDVAWLGFDWERREFYASDYFEHFYNFALELIKKEKAYVCSLSADEVRQTRGSLTEPGTESPYRSRSIEENLKLFEEMKNGVHPDGLHTLRAKIDMSAGNINMRDPAIYRIRKEHHHRTGSAWCIYPMYDFAHGISDALEKITHSLCTLEFEDHRPLYDWFLDNISIDCHPKQIEFARLNLTYTVLSKRKLLRLVENKLVSGWDDPRMPTLSGFRRRGYTPSAIREFCSRIGIAKADSTVDIELLNFCQREEFNKTAERRMAVLEPLKVTVANYPEDKIETLVAQNNPEDRAAGTRPITFSRHLYIERGDFMEDPPKKWFRLAPGKEVRFLHAYYLTCKEVIKDSETGEVTELICTYDPDTRGGWSEDGRKVKGTLHWVSQNHCIRAEVRLFENLFLMEKEEDIEQDKDFTDYLNPNSITVLKDCMLEPCLKEAAPEQRYQFVRNGYFCLDKDSKPDGLVFNRTLPLKDSWSKLQKKA
jgi:glutaminyl-tRNA synthetase